MELTDREWVEFNLSGDNGIFENYHGKRLVKNKRIKGTIPMLTAGEQNQGVDDFISNSDMSTFKDFISIDMFGNAFYHEYICCGDDNIYFFVNDKISKNAKLFIVNSINNNKCKYSYGKQFRQGNADRSKIMLPVKINDSTKPDWEFMELYIKEKYEDKVKLYKTYAQKALDKLVYEDILPLNEKEWKEFLIIDLFDSIQRGKRLTKSSQIKGKIPYISSTARNNGVDNYISNDKKVRRFSNCLTIANSGSVGSSFYHPYEFIASDHVTHLKNESMNKYIYLFISVLTNRLSEKYNFNREINEPRLSRERIILPIDSFGNPDYNYMEQYVKNILIEKYKKYLNFKK